MGGAPLTREWSNPWNPFNSAKALVWPEAFESLSRGKIPDPISVTIDPTNRCSLGCVWCHCGDWRREAPVQATAGRLLALADSLVRWERRPRSVCIAGGGEPLMHPATPQLIRKLVAGGLQVGMITNGLLLTGDALQAARLCRWVGFSVDAATPATYCKLKRTKRETFQRVLGNIRALASLPGRPSIGFKFLFHPENIDETFSAAFLAKTLGCDDFHARPLFAPGLEYTAEQVGEALTGIGIARGALEDEHFHVYGVQHKFDAGFHRSLPSRCAVTPLSGLVFTATGETYVCCDARGDPWARLSTWEDIDALWGSPKHREILRNLQPQRDCHRRCTYGPYQEILEYVFVRDSMCRAFI